MFKDIKQFLMKRGHSFESETDTEVIAKLAFHIYQNHKVHVYISIITRYGFPTEDHYRPQIRYQYCELCSFTFTYCIEHQTGTEDY